MQYERVIVHPDKLRDLATNSLWNLENALANERGNALVDRLSDGINHLMDNLTALRNRLSGLPNRDLVRSVDEAVLSLDYDRLIFSAQEALADRSKLAEAVDDLEVLLSTTRSIMKLCR